MFALALHLFGHINDLPHSDEPYDLMYDLSTVRDLDAMRRLNDGAAGLLIEELDAVADLRLEEQRGRPRDYLTFFMRAMWINRRDIAGSVLRTRPWALPFRLSRLSTAAVSAMVILVMTAEVWDLGTRQPPAFVAALSATVLFGATGYLLHRQQLLQRRRTGRPSEQRVITQVSIALSVLLGMTTTYLVLFAGVLAIALTFFDTALIEGWAASVDDPSSFRSHLVLAGFIGSVGLVIGALGGSFEEQTYFRHVAFVDEET